MKTILLFGAGKSATVCLNYLAEKSKDNSFKFVVAEADHELLLAKTKLYPHVHAQKTDIFNDQERISIISEATVVISMLPPSLHILVANDCIKAGVNLLTASYLDEEMKKLEPLIIEKNILFVCEMGLDPGIDHMSAMQLFEDIHNEGGEIISFKSHCGGLVAPESDDNPWHYKISWNPANVVNAGKSGAVFLQDNKIVEVPYSQLFSDDHVVESNDEEINDLCYYPNRDSLSYIPIYQLPAAKTFLRTTLRHHDFMVGWQAIVRLQLTETETVYDTEHLSVALFFQQHLQQHGLQILEQELTQNEKVKELFNFLGLYDFGFKLNIGMVNTVEILRYILEHKLKLQPTDKDMIVMIHEIEYKINEEVKYLISSLVVKGNDALRTAMAKTVGLPLAICALLIIKDKIKLKGLYIPTIPEIYRPVLNELANNNVQFKNEIN